MSTYKLQYTSGSATSTADLGDAAMGIRNDALAQLNPTNLAYGFYAVDASGRLFVTGTLGVSASNLTASVTQGTTPWIVSGNVVISGTATVIPSTSTGVTADGLAGANSQIAAAYNYIKSSGGDTWDRWAEVLSGATSSGVGVAMIAPMYQWNDSAVSPSPSAFATPRISQNRNVYMVIRDNSANAERGAAVDVNNALKVFVASGNNVTAAISSGTITINPTGITATLASGAQSIGSVTISGTATIAATTVTASQNGVVWGVTSSGVTASASVDGDTYAQGVTRGYGSFGLVTAASPGWAASAMRPIRINTDGAQAIFATAAWGVTGNLSAVTASQNGVIWGISGSVTVLATALTAVPASSTALTADGIGAVSGQTVAAFAYVKTSGGNTWDRWATVPAGATSSGATGLPMVAPMWQYDDTSTVSAVENFFGTPRMSNNRLAYVATPRSIKAIAHTQVTSSAEVTAVSAIASTFNDIYGVLIANQSTAVATMTFKDSVAGTTRFAVTIPGTETRGFMLPDYSAIPQSAVNITWTMQSSTAVSTLYVSIYYMKNT